MKRVAGRCLACGQHEPARDRASAYQIVLEGSPMPKVRPRFDSRSKRAYNPKEYTEWKEDVALQAKAQHMPHFNGPVSIEVALRADTTLVVVQSIDTERPKHVRGDVDNYVGSYMDALQGIAYENDRQVHDLRGRWLNE